MASGQENVPFQELYIFYYGGSTFPCLIHPPAQEQLFLLYRVGRQNFTHCRKVGKAETSNRLGLYLNFQCGGILSSISSEQELGYLSSASPKVLFSLSLLLVPVSSCDT